MAVSFGTVAAVQRVDVVERQRRAPLPQAIQRPTGRQPAQKRRPVPHRLAGANAVGLQKDFLNDVLGIRGVAENAPGRAEHQAPWSRTIRFQSVTARVSWRLREDIFPTCKSSRLFPMLPAGLGRVADPPQTASGGVRMIVTGQETGRKVRTVVAGAVGNAWNGMTSPCSASSRR